MPLCVRPAFSMLVCWRRGPRLAIGTPESTLRVIAFQGSSYVVLLAEVLGKRIKGAYVLCLVMGQNSCVTEGTGDM